MKLQHLYTSACRSSLPYAAKIQNALLDNSLCLLRVYNVILFITSVLGRYVIQVEGMRI